MSGELIAYLHGWRPGYRSWSRQGRPAAAAAQAWTPTPWTARTPWACSALQTAPTVARPLPSRPWRRPMKRTTRRRSPSRPAVVSTLLVLITMTWDSDTVRTASMAAQAILDDTSVTGTMGYVGTGVALTRMRNVLSCTYYRRHGQRRIPSSCRWHATTSMTPWSCGCATSARLCSRSKDDSLSSIAGKSRPAGTGSGESRRACR